MFEIVFFGYACVVAWEKSVKDTFCDIDKITNKVRLLK